MTLLLLSILVAALVLVVALAAVGGSRKAEPPKVSSPIPEVPEVTPKALANRRAAVASRTVRIPPSSAKQKTDFLLRLHRAYNFNRRRHTHLPTQPKKLRRLVRVGYADQILN